MKTTMQQFQDFIYEQIEKYKDHPGVAIDKISQQSHYMLDIEKKQIQYAFIAGSWDTSGIQDENEMSNNYYQETFGDKVE